MKIILVQSKFLVKFCLIFFVTNISNIDRHSSIHQKKASWWIVCVKYLQISQILIITSGENYWILNWFWSSPKQCPHKKASTDKRGKLNCFVFEVRWCLVGHSEGVKGKFQNYQIISTKTALFYSQKWK